METRSPFLRLRLLRSKLSIHSTQLPEIPIPEGEGTRDGSVVQGTEAEATVVEDREAVINSSGGTHNIMLSTVQINMGVLVILYPSTLQFSSLSIRWMPTAHTAIRLRPTIQ